MGLKILLWIFIFKFYKQIFSDKIIYEKYLYYINKFLEEDLIGNFFKQNEKDIYFQKTLLHGEFPKSTINYKDFYNKQSEFILNFFNPSVSISAHYYGDSHNQFSVGNLQFLPIHLIDIQDYSGNVYYKFTNNRIPGKSPNQSVNLNFFRSSDKLSKYLETGNSLSKLRIRYRIVGNMRDFYSKFLIRKHPSEQ